MEEAVRTLDPIQAEIEFLAALDNLTADNAPEALAAIRANSEGSDLGPIHELLTTAVSCIGWPPLNTLLNRRKGRGLAPGRRFPGGPPTTALTSQAWVDEEGSSSTERSDVRGLVTGMARWDPDTAQKYIEGLPEGRAQ